MTDWSTITNLAGLLTIPNDNTGGWFWLGMILMLVIVAVISFSNFGIETALMAGSFLGLMLCILATYMNLIAWSWTLVFVGAILFTFLYIIYTKQ